VQKPWVIAALYFRDDSPNQLRKALRQNLERLTGSSWVRLGGKGLIILEKDNQTSANLRQSIRKVNEQRGKKIPSEGVSPRGFHKDCKFTREGLTGSFQPHRKNAVRLSGKRD